MVHLKEVLDMDLESIISITAISMKACGKKTKGTVKESTIIRMEKYIEAFIDKDKERVLVHLTIKMEIGTKENGEMETSMDLEHTITVLVKCIWAIIKTIKEMARVDTFTRMA